MEHFASFDLYIIINFQFIVDLKMDVAYRDIFTSGLKKYFNFLCAVSHVKTIYSFNLLWVIPAVLTRMFHRILLPWGLSCFAYMHNFLLN